MAISHQFIVVSGIPGCGKSTVGRALAELLDIPCLEKDKYLELRMSKAGCMDEEARHRLSRLADQDFQDNAMGCGIAVLDSFWRHPMSKAKSGTPSKWLTAPNICCAEIFCECPAGLAATRFLDRRRDAGHLDGAWTHASLEEQSRNLLLELPLLVGELIEVDTAKLIDYKRLVDRVSTTLGR